LQEWKSKYESVQKEKEELAAKVSGMAPFMEWYETKQQAAELNLLRKLDEAGIHPSGTGKCSTIVFC